jgi:hypothetical protein
MKESSVSMIIMTLAPISRKEIQREELGRRRSGKERGDERRERVV